MICYSNVCIFTGISEIKTNIPVGSMKLLMDVFPNQRISIFQTIYVSPLITMTV